MLRNEGQDYSFSLLTVPLCAQHAGFLPSQFERPRKNGLPGTGRGFC